MFWTELENKRNHAAQQNHFILIQPYTINPDIKCFLKWTEMAGDKSPAAENKKYTQSEEA